MTKRRVLASLGLTWGVFIVLHGFAVLAGGLHGTVGWDAGQIVAWLFGAWLIYFSGRALVRALNKGTGPSPTAPSDHRH